MLTAREDGSDKKKQLMIILGRGAQRGSRRAVQDRVEETRVTDLWDVLFQGPVTQFHSLHVLIKHLLWVLPPSGWCHSDELGSPIRDDRRGTYL